MSKTIEQVKMEIRNLRYEVEEDITITNEIKYTDDEIEILLRKLPVAQFQAAQTIVLRLIDYKEARRRLKKEFAIQMIKANAKDKLTSAADRKAWAENTNTVEKAEIELINAEAQYKIAEFRFDMLDNLYLAVKKMVIMRTSQNEAEERATRSRSPRRG